MRGGGGGREEEEEDEEEMIKGNGREDKWVERKRR